jgi:phage-related protein
MASRPQVTLTFAGDSSDLEQTFDRVGGGAEEMADEVEDSTRSFDDLGGGIDTLGQKGGDLESGFRGITDSMSGFSQIAEGDVMGGLTDLAGGAEALAAGFSGVLVPALQKTVGWLAQTRVGMAAMAVWQGIVSTATKVWTGIQAAFNFVMALNPVVLIIVAIAALIAIIVVIATRTQWFQNIWRAVWEGIQAVVRWWWQNVVVRYFNALRWVWERIVDGARWVWRGIQRYFGFWKGMFDRVVGWIRNMWNNARDNLNRVVDFVRGIPERVRNALSGLGNALSAPFRAGFQAAKDFWNSTIGGKGFTIPSWVPFVGGRSFTFPYFHQGGIVPGAPGQEILGVLQAGERVIPAGQVDRGGGPLVVYLMLDREVLGKATIENIRRGVHTNQTFRADLRRAVA